VHPEYPSKYAQPTVNIERTGLREFLNKCCSNLFSLFNLDILVPVLPLFNRSVRFNQYLNCSRYHETRGLEK